MKIIPTIIILMVFLLSFFKSSAQGGTIDYSFNIGSNFNEWVHTIAVQPDDKIIAGGFFTSFDGAVANRLIRLHVNGARDTSFNIGSGFNDSDSAFIIGVNNVLLQSNGKMIVYGSFTTFNGNPCNKIIRLHSNGSFDSSFSLDSATCENTDQMYIQSDDKLICIGHYAVNGQLLFGLRYHEDGSLDTSFTLDTLITSLHSNSIELLPDGKVLIGGENTINGVTNNGIIRLNSDGNLDLSFQANLNNDVQRIVYNDFTQKIVFFGTDLPYPGPNRLKQLNLDGSSDLSFMEEVVSNGFSTLIDQPDGKLVVTGSFVNYQNHYRQGIVRLNANGTVDQSFFPKIRLAFVFDQAMQSDGKLIFVGAESLYWPDTIIDHMLRLSACSTFSLGEIYTCDTFCTVNGVNYYTPGQHNQYLVNAAGCDSVFHFYAGFDQFRLTSLANVFATETSSPNCDGELYFKVQGNSPFHMQLDTNTWQALPNYTNTYSYGFLSGQCSGLYDLRLSGACGDTLNTTIVIPSASNSMYSNQSGGNQPTDTLGAVVENCEVDYNSIDTMFVENVWTTAVDTCIVVWNIHDMNGTHYDTLIFNHYLQASSLVLYQLSIYCPNKNNPLYFTGTHINYYVPSSTAEIEEHLKAIDVFLSPNPTFDCITISTSKEELFLEIWDVKGDLMEAKPVISGETIELRMYEDGVYIFKFSSKNESLIKRIVKL